jgi:hypothetical protein
VSVKLFIIFYLILYLICLCRVHGCQRDFWRLNPHTNKWEGNLVFGSDYRAYYESLKNQAKQTETSTQALPMLPKDLQIIMEYLDTVRNLFGVLFLGFSGVR